MPPIKPKTNRSTITSDKLNELTKLTPNLDKGVLKLGSTPRIDIEGVIIRKVLSF